MLSAMNAWTWKQCVEDIVYRIFSLPLQMLDGRKLSLLDSFKFRAHYFASNKHFFFKKINASKKAKFSCSRFGHLGELKQ